MESIEYKPENLTDNQRFLIRNWFDTVLKPLRNLMKSQKETLESKNFGFRHDTNRLEYLTPINLSFSEYDLNFEQFLNFYPDLSEIVAKYDNKINKLNKQFLNLFHKVANDDEFDKILKENDVEPEDKAYFISYILNSRKELFRNYSNFELYNKISTKLFGFLNSKYLKEEKEILNLIEDLKIDTEKIEQLAKSIIMQLSIQTSTPITSSNGFTGATGPTGSQGYF